MKYRGYKFILYGRGNIRNEDDFYSILSLSLFIIVTPVN